MVKKEIKENVRGSYPEIAEHKSILNKFSDLDEKIRLYFFGETFDEQKIYFSNENDCIYVINCCLLKMNSTSFNDIEHVKFDVDEIKNNFKSVVLKEDDLKDLHDLVTTYNFLYDMFIFYKLGFAGGHPILYTKQNVSLNFRDEKLFNDTYEKMVKVIKKIEQMFEVKK